MHALEELNKFKEKNVMQQKLLEKYKQEKHEEHEKETKTIADLKSSNRGVNKDPSKPINSAKRE